MTLQPALLYNSDTVLSIATGTQSGKKKAKALHKRGDGGGGGGEEEIFIRTPPPRFLSTRHPPPWHDARAVPYSACNV